MGCPTGSEKFEYLNDDLNDETEKNICDLINIITMMEILNKLMISDFKENIMFLIKF